MAGFTRNAYKLRFVKGNNESGAYFDNMRCGTYRATGTDINGKRISREYIVDQSDNNSPWPMWRDFNGRFGLRNLWFIGDNGRILIYSKD